MAKKPEGATADQRAERLAAALRENLKRRKQQARGRAADGQTRAPSKDPPDRDPSSKP